MYSYILCLYVLLHTVYICTPTYCVYMYSYILCLYVLLHTVYICTPYILCIYVLLTYCVYMYSLYTQYVGVHIYTVCRSTYKHSM
jgi:hypothetical protein